MADTKSFAPLGSGVLKQNVGCLQLRENQNSWPSARNMRSTAWNSMFYCFAREEGYIRQLLYNRTIRIVITLYVLLLLVFSCISSDFRSRRCLGAESLMMSLQKTWCEGGAGKLVHGGTALDVQAIGLAWI